MQRYSEVDAGTLIPFIIASILFAIRMSAKSLRLGGGWGADDYTLIPAYVGRGFSALVTRSSNSRL